MKTPRASVPRATRRATSKRRQDSLGERIELKAGFSAAAIGHDYDAEELEFLAAMDRYKRDTLRAFPAWSEVLAVLRALGYSKSKKNA